MKTNDEFYNTFFTDLIRNDQISFVKAIDLFLNKKDIIPHLYKKKILNLDILDKLLKNYYPISSSHIALFIENSETLFLNKIFQSYLPFPSNITKLLTAFKNHEKLTYDQINHLNNLNIFDSSIDVEGITPIMLAVKKNESNIAWHLINMGVDIFRRDNHGNTLLHLASYYNNEEMVQFLVNNGVDVNAQNEKGNTALMNACLMKNNEIIEFLINQDIQEKTDVNLKNNEGESALPLYLQDPTLLIHQEILHNN